MSKTVIQVPMDNELLKELNKISKKQRKARAQLIRQACHQYLAEEEKKELDRIYVEGYRRIPENTDIAESQIAMAKDILPDEDW